MRICIIDDNVLLANALTFGLEDRGHQVTCARTGMDGLAEIEAGDYDVAVIDWQMPGLRGDAVAERVRALRPGIAIVLMSGGSVRDDIETVRGRRDLVDHYIEKPFTPGQLLDAIALALANANTANNASS
jgi:DNA-binding response OmpR family regulator